VERKHPDTGHAKQRLRGLLGGEEFDALCTPGGRDVDRIACAQTTLTRFPEGFFQEPARNGDPAGVGKELLIKRYLIPETMIRRLGDHLEAHQLVRHENPIGVVEKAYGALREAGHTAGGSDENAGIDEGSSQSLTLSACFTPPLTEFRFNAGQIKQRLATANDSLPYLP
jgi:hypothetical protein